MANYLNRNNRPVLDDTEFCDSHLIYRVKQDKNPITLFNYPHTLPELSCNWSKFVIPSDLIKEKPQLGEYIYVTTVDALKKFKLSYQKTEGTNHDGTHVLKCYLYHAPEELDYSHVQIDILHEINTSSINETRRYTRENWKKGECLLTTDNKSIKNYFKNLREEYKYHLFHLFNELDESLYNIPTKEFLEANPSLKEKRWIAKVLEKLFSLFKK